MGNIIATIIQQANLEELKREYSGTISKEEERRVKFDLKHRLPYRIKPRRPGVKAQKVKQI